MLQPYNHHCKCSCHNTKISLNDCGLTREQLVTAKQQAETHVSSLRGTLADLDELSDIMAEMLERQEAAEVKLYSSTFSMA